MNIRFTDEMNPARAAKVIDVLRAPRLWIPTQQDYGADHEVWLEKVEAELAAGKRYALHAQMGRRSVGVIIWRPNTQPRTVDIRNISVSPEVRGRYFGPFMLRNVEYDIHKKYPDVKEVRVDTKTTNTEMRAFLGRQDYIEVGVEDLYDSGKPDVILQKIMDE